MCDNIACDIALSLDNSLRKYRTLAIAGVAICDIDNGSVIINAIKCDMRNFQMMCEALLGECFLFRVAAQVEAVTAGFLHVSSLTTCALWYSQDRESTGEERLYIDELIIC